MSTPALSQTTLSAAITATQTRFGVASTTGINGLGSLTSPQSIIVVGSEAMLVLNVPVSGVVEVTRGVNGTKARAHASGVLANFGAKTSFGFTEPGVMGSDGLVGLSGDPGTMPAFRLPVGVCVYNPDDGNEYRMVDCQAAMAIGSWVVITGAGLASALAATSKGRVGVIQETVGGSDTYSWALVAGTSSNVQFTSGVTTACYLIAGTAIADILTSTDANIIWGASCTAAPSSATDLGTGYLDHPWVSGVNTSFAS